MNFFGNLEEAIRDKRQVVEAYDLMHGRDGSYNVLRAELNYLISMLDIYNKLKYRVLSEGLDLNTIPRHKFLHLFKKRDQAIEEIVDSMILELLLGLEGISYSHYSHSLRDEPHHFILHKKGPHGSPYKERLKYSQEELAKLYPLDLFFAAWKKSDYKLMEGVKNSPLVRSVCVYLYDMRLAEKIRSLT